MKPLITRFSYKITENKIKCFGEVMTDKRIFELLMEKYCFTLLYLVELLFRNGF